MGAGVRGKNGLPQDTCIHLYKIHGLPVLTYSMGVFSVTEDDLKPLEQFQKNNPETAAVPRRQCCRSHNSPVKWNPPYAVRSSQANPWFPRLNGKKRHFGGTQRGKKATYNEDHKVWMAPLAFFILTMICAIDIS